MTAGAVAIRREGRRWWTVGGRAAGHVATVTVIVAVWLLVTEAGLVSPQTLPSLPDVTAAFTTLAGEGQIWPIWRAPLFRILLSFALGIVLGLPLGTALWRFPLASSALRPYLAATYSIPLVVFYPFLLVVLGLNDWPVVVLTAVMTTIPICLNTQVGLDTVRPVLVNVGRSLERTPWQIFWQILLPAAWP